MTDQAQAQGVIPHLVVRDAAAALEFYKNAMGATETMRLPAEDGNDAIVRRTVSVHQRGCRSGR